MQLVKQDVAKDNYNIECTYCKEGMFYTQKKIEPRYDTTEEYNDGITNHFSYQYLTGQQIFIDFFFHYFYFL